MIDERYKLIAENVHSTVVTAYKPQPRQSTAYQSEAELEAAFISQLQSQGYEYLQLTTEQQLIANLRQQLERLNDYLFSDSEWNRFFHLCIANAKDGIVEKTRLIQEDHVQNLVRDNGEVKNIMLINKDNVHANSLQVINQYVPEGGVHDNRYDVTILVNGLPLVHVELKRRGVSLKEAFNQINRYNRDSFWAGAGLFEFAQLFVISNGTETKYYSNTTRDAHVNEVKKNAKAGKQQTSHSFEFTSYWADRSNKTIRDLVDFTATFFAKHAVLNILTKYCIFTSEKLLLVMRPYQIAATESIISRIEIASNYKDWGTLKGGGYVWHTTGSGKTLTSFKSARMASQLPMIDKVLFVVDRKDLDYQTMKEYDRFEKGAANSNRSTTVLTRQLGDPNARIIITTIQKLSTFIKKNKEHEVYDKHVVMIFDECHRSQFGEMHVAITKKFKKYHIFGFTGTPIFPANSGSTKNPLLVTTEQAFGDQLHIYTIVDAIRDENVLPFRIDYVTTMKNEKDIMDEQVYNIDRERAFASPERIANVVTYILEHFNQKTKRNGKAYVFNKTQNISKLASAKNGKVEEIKDKVRLSGFNSIFCVASIPVAKLYYLEFMRQMEQLVPEKRLRIATIYSYGANEAEDDFSGIIDDENSDDTSMLDQSSRDFLEQAISDYNTTFGTNYDTSSEKFQNYYKDVSLRMKNREIDLLIVVNMFLTGFDATTLNTLWVDKNLRQHGLLQAYSRTNRILNSIKSFGNVVCFRNLEKETNDALALFGDKESGGTVIIHTFEDYNNGYEDEGEKWVKGYHELMVELLERFPLGQDINGESEEKDFIRLFGAILRATNLLSTFDQFADAEHLSERDLQDYTSIYNKLYEKYRGQNENESTVVNDDIEFEMELVRQIEVNIDYILFLISQLHDDNTQDTELIIKIRKSIESSPDLRNKKDLIENFIDQLTPNDEVTEAWQRYAEEQRKQELDRIIEEEKLRPQPTYDFVRTCFEDGEVKESGTEITKILPPMSLFSKDGERGAKKDSVLKKLKAFFDKFFSISSGHFDDEDEVEHLNIKHEPKKYVIPEDNGYFMVAEPSTMEASYSVGHNNEVPSKDNWRYLPIDREFFDQIISGIKQVEYREIKDTTYKWYLETDENGSLIVNRNIVPEGQVILKDPFIYNNGIYPFVPKRYKYLYLAVGYNKVRPTAIVEVKSISFKPAAVRGNRAKWIVEYHLGKVVEVNIPE